MLYATIYRIACIRHPTSTIGHCCQVETQYEDVLQNIGGGLTSTIMGNCIKMYCPGAVLVYPLQPCGMPYNASVKDVCPCKTGART